MSWLLDFLIYPNPTLAKVILKRLSGMVTKFAKPATPLLFLVQTFI
jgi:hypothetical protein